jgi:hypothetical protein
MTIAQVRVAAAAAVDALSTVRCAAYVGPVNPPCAFVMRRERDPRMVMDAGKANYPFAIVVFASRANDRSAQVTLDALFEQSGSGSIKQALESDSTLGALVDYGQVTRIGGEEIAEVSGVEYVTTTVDFEVVF